MQRGAWLLVLCLLGLLPASVRAQQAPRRTGPAAALHALVAREWQYQLAHNPTFAAVTGDRRWAGRWEDLSLAALEADHRHNQEVLAALARIDRRRLGAEDALTYDLFRRDYAEWVEGHRFRLFLLPVSPQGGLPEGLKQPPALQAAFQLADALRFETAQDYADWVQRLQGLGTYADQTMALMRQGLAERRVHPRIVLQRLPAQVEKQLVATPEQSAFYAPFTRMPASLPEAERRRLAAAGRAAVADTVLPALRRFHRFLTAEYLPAAPEEVGAWAQPEGEALYAFLARRYTTTRLTPDEVHALGLSEVARLRAEMEAVKARTGFRGTLPEFFTHLRTAPQFYFRTGEELLLHYRALTRRIDPALVKLFRTLPRQPYAVEPTPATLAPDATTGFYYPGAADGSRPGTYLVNLYKPETRPRWEMVPLTLHEAMPGHHLQTSLAAEQQGLPDFRRFAYHSAFGEGWALYCETLGDELGLYTDPHDKFGELAYQMWRAVRLVVDTGLHARRWSRQQAITYFLENAPRQELDVVNEVDRYIATPGQALAYKVGQLKIRELRTRAERTLGPRFDVRGFHDAVLLAGSLPLDLLEARVDAWVRAESARRPDPR